MISFDYGDVTLLDGLVRDSVEETMAFYLNIPVDNMLKQLRELAGLPADGVHYTGWFEQHHGMGLLGQWLSAHARMYAITRLEAYRDKISLMVKGWLECYKILQEKVLGKESFYAFEKMLQGYLDVMEYCGTFGMEKHIRDLVDLAAEKMDRTNLFGDNGHEWYTMPESLYRAYRATGYEKARQAAEYWEYREYWDLFYKGEDPFPKKPKAGLFSEFCHAYSHVNSFNSAAMAYEVKGDPYYLEAMERFHRFMTRTQTYCTGGFGSEFEHIMPLDRMIHALKTGHDSFETQCCSYAVYRLEKYLMRFTGEAKYGDWTERLIYNATVATIPMTSDGKVIYYSDYNLYDAKKINRQAGWTCCTGTRPLAVAELPRLIYFHDDAGLYVSQYIPSALTWRGADGDVQVRQETEYPEDDRTVLTVSLDRPSCFSLSFRVPGWVTEPLSLFVNGARQKEQIQNGWMVVRREWNDGDRVELILPRRLWVSRLDPAAGKPCAVMDGPVALAAKTDVPMKLTEAQKLVDGLSVTEGLENTRGLHYRVKGHPELWFRPFYEYAEYEPYFLYFDCGLKD